MAEHINDNMLQNEKKTAVGNIGIQKLKILNEIRLFRINKDAKAAIQKFMASHSYQ